MKNAIKFFIVLGVLFTILSSCASTTALTNAAPDNIPIVAKEVEIIGTVKVEFTRHGVIGLIPDLSLISWGDRSSYVALLEEAKKIGADDVVNIKTDLINSSILVFYSRFTWVATALAVKYVD